MPLGPRFFDQDHETPGNRGNVIDLWGVEDDWSFGTEGALALQPEPAEPEIGGRLPPAQVSRKHRRFRLPRPVTSLRVPRMATTEAAGFAARTRRRQREEARAKARRARRTAALVVVASGCLVALLLTAFGTGGSSAVTITGPAPADRLLPAGPPRPQIVAMQDSLRLQLPVNQSRVTVLGYHAAGTDALALEPVGTQANAGLAERLFRRLFGSSGSDVRYYVLDGGVGPATGGLDVGAPVDTDVYAPVDGSVIAVADHVVNGKAYGVQIDIQPSGNPGVVVTLVNLRADPALTVGSTVSAGRTKIGRVIDLSQVERAGLARYTQDNGQHVHLEVHTATVPTSP
jgi:Peptidase family M23